MGEATQDEPPFNFIVVYKLRNFSWSLDETVLSRDRAQGQRRISRLHDGKLALNADRTDNRLPDPGSGNLHRQPRCCLQRPHHLTQADQGQSLNAPTTH